MVGTLKLSKRAQNISLRVDKVFMNSMVYLISSQSLYSSCIHALILRQFYLRSSSLIPH